MPRLPNKNSNSAFNGMTHGHQNPLSGSRLTRDRADLNNSHATQNGVTQGPLFREVGARPGVPEASSSRTGTRKSGGVKGFTVKGQARQKMTPKSPKLAPKLTRRSGGPGKKVDGSDRKKRMSVSSPATADAAQVPKAKKPKGFNANGSARWKGSKGFNKDGSARKTGSGGRVKGAEGVRTKAARLQERLREEGAQEGSSAAPADDGCDEHGASLSVLA